MKQLAIMADIHSNYPNFRLVLNYIKAHHKQIQEFVFLGDYVMNGFDGNKILDEIKSFQGIVLAGNKEEFFSTKNT